MKKILNKFTFFVCTFMIFSTVTAFAATTLLTYNGTGIGGKYSVNSFTLSSKSNVTVSHETTAWSNCSPSISPTLNIQVCKKGTLGTYSAVDSFSKTGIGSTSKKFSLSSGTYKLYFYTNHSTAKANINGSVYK